MGLSLQKGQSLSLTKSDGGSLSRVRMGLGWDSAAPTKRGLFGRVNRTQTQSELFIFITPRILRNDQDADEVTKPKQRPPEPPA